MSRVRRLFAFCLVLSLPILFSISALRHVQESFGKSADVSQPVNGVAVVSSSVQRIDLRVHVGKVFTDKVRGRSGFMVDHVYLVDGEPIGITGGPDLPVFRKLIALPACADIDVDFHVAKERYIAGVVPGRFEESILGTGREGDKILAGSSDATANATWGPRFPRETVHVLRRGYLRGQHLALLEVCPVQWESTNRLRVIEDMTVTIRPRNPKGPSLTNVGPMQRVVDRAALNSRRPSIATRVTSVLQPMRTNGSGAFRWCAGSTWEATADSVKTFGADYLIIVADSLAADTVGVNLVDSLAIHRSNYNGFNVAIVKLSSIDSSPDTSSTPVTIREFIKEIYESRTAPHQADSLLAYVLLLGDAFAPDRSIAIPSSYAYKGNNIINPSGLIDASDMYYSFLTDDPATDPFPDLWIGRLPVDKDPTFQELRNVVTKIHQYEPLPLSAAWKDRVLMVSGGDDTGFSFDGEGGDGFAAFFDSIEAYHIPDSKTVRKMHVLQAGLSDNAFSKAVVDTLRNGFHVCGLFDHGNFFYLRGQNPGGCFVPKHYDTLSTNYPSVVFAIGSHLGEFDYTADKVGGSNPCCTSPRLTGCLPTPVTIVDSCDVMTERLLVQPKGAIAAFGYTRSQGTISAQEDFRDLFRALYEENGTQLGEVSLAVRFLRASNQITMRGLTLFGDPALNIQWEDVGVDTVDLAVGASGISSDRGMAYLASNGSNTLTITVRNLGPKTTTAVVEVWDGDPADTASTRLDSTTVAVPGFGDRTDEHVIGSQQIGTHDIFVIIDPNSELVELSRENNIASRRFRACPFHADYPVKLDARVHHAVTLADVHPTSGTEILLATTLGATCIAEDGTILWEVRRSANLVKVASPSIGTVFEDGEPVVYWEAPRSATSTYGYLIDPTDGTVVDSLSMGYAYSYVGQSHMLGDFVANNDSLEVLTIGWDPNAHVSYLRMRDLQGNKRWEQSLGDVSVAPAMWAASLACGDMDGDGEVEVVLAASDKLRTYDATDGTPGWSTTIGSTNPGATWSTRELVLVDGDDDGDLEAFVVGEDGSSNPWIARYDKDGNRIWGHAVEDSAYFSVGDIDRDDNKEIVVASRRSIRIIAADGTGIDSTSIAVGRFVSAPVLADMTGDPDLEIAIVALVPGNPYFPQDLERNTFVVRFFDANLDSAAETLTFPADFFSQYEFCHPAVSDLDGDGNAEFVFASADSVLHVIDVGTGDGNGDWNQRYGNEMKTNLYEQPVVGTYGDPMAFFNRCKVLGDAEFDSTVYIDRTARFVVANEDAANGGRDSSRCEIDFNGSLRVVGSDLSLVAFRPVTSQSGPAKPWWGICLNTDASDNLVRNCLIEDAEIGLNVVKWPSADSLLSKVEILDSNVGMRSAVAIGNFQGISVSESDTGFVTVTGVTTFKNISAAECGVGFVQTGTSALVDEATFVGCDTAVVASTDLTMKDSDVTDAQVNGVWARGGDLHLQHISIAKTTGARTTIAVKIDSTVTTALLDTCQVSGANTAVQTETGTDFVGCSIAGCSVGVVASPDSTISLDHCTISFDSIGVSALGPLELIASRVLKSGTGPGTTAVSAPSAYIHSSYLDATLSAVSIDSGFMFTDTLSSDTYGLVMAGPVTCRQSRILGNGSNFYGIDASDGSSDLVLRGTLVSGYDIGTYLGQGSVADIDSGCTFSGNDTGLHAYASSDIAIRGSTFDGNTTNGVSLNASYAVIEGNTVTGSTNGIFFYASDGAIQERNVIEENGSGVKCDEESAPTIHENKIASNSVGITALNDANPDVGMCCDEEGVECDTTGTCEGEGRNNISGNTSHHIVNLSPSITISAECNYWGSRGPLPSKFSGAVDYNPYLGENPVPELVAGGPPGSMPNTVDALPIKYDVGQNYPNPFNPVTTIRYQVPRPGGSVQLIIYDVRGGVVRTLVNEAKAPGYYTLNWDGGNDQGATVASGVYFLRMTAPSFVKTQKLVVVK